MMFNKTESTIIKASQFLHSNLFPHRALEDGPRSRPSFTLTNKKFSKSCHSEVCPKKSPLPPSDSRTISIQFNSSAKKVVPEEVLVRRRMLSSSEKFYNKKKAVVFNFIRQKNQEYQDLLGEKQFLKVGSHQIRPDLKSEEGCLAKSGIVFRKKFKKEKRMSVKHENFISETSSELVMQSKKLTKADQFFTTLPPSFRKMAENSNIQVLMKQKTEPVLIAKEGNRSTTEFEEFIPIKKRKQRKEPFVFGLSDKAFFNPQKNAERLFTYHDFLWKVNYANGLCVKVPENELNYNAFVGPGNNCNLVRSILKRRYWWTLSDRMESCQFVWTQLKVNLLYKLPQQTASRTEPEKLYTFHLQGECASEAADPHGKIFNSIDLSNWRQHMAKNSKFQQSLNERTYKHRVNFYKCRRMSVIDSSSQLLVHNHLPSNFYIGNKKALFYFMRNYYELTGQPLSSALPLTFHIIAGINDPNYKAFLKAHQELEERRRKGEEVRNVWIIKPGENSNRGNGITVCFSLDEIKQRVNGRERSNDGTLRTFILQKYIERPLLYRGRKFDLRHYMLLTCINGLFRAYWFPEGYVRTASYKFSLSRDSGPFVHLTNDAVQKNGEEYGKYERGNKVSYQAFGEYLERARCKEEGGEGSGNVFFGQILPKMRSLALDAVRATYLHLDPQRRQHNFELLGMDFMIDGDLSPFLIEINTNPCLELSSPLLAALIPALLEETFKLCVDPLFPPPQDWQPARRPYFAENPLGELRYELLFDEAAEGRAVRELLHRGLEVDRKMGRVDEDAETFENDGDAEEDE